MQVTSLALPTVGPMAHSPVRVDQPRRPQYLRDLGGVESELRRMADDHPDRARVIDVGSSVQGRDVLGLVLGTRADDPAVPRVLLTAGLHPRETANPETLLQWARRTLEAVDAGDPARRALLDERTVILVPMVNPDGYTRVTDGLDRGDAHGTWQRTNLRAGGGVDLNRNFAGAWGPGSTTPGNQHYRGPAPASEPEVRGVEQLGAQWRPAGVYDLHSQGGVVLVGSSDARAAAQLVARATGYSVSTSREHWPNEVGGTVKDWARERLGATSLTIETGAVNHQDDAQYADTLGRMLPALDALVATVDGRHAPPTAAAGLATPPAASRFVRSEHLGDAVFADPALLPG